MRWSTEEQKTCIYTGSSRIAFAYSKERERVHKIQPLQCDLFHSLCGWHSYPHLLCASVEVLCPLSCGGLRYRKLRCVVSYKQNRGVSLSVKQWNIFPHKEISLHWLWSLSSLSWQGSGPGPGSFLPSSTETACRRLSWLTTVSAFVCINKKILKKPQMWYSLFWQIYQSLHSDQQQS